MLVFVSLAEDLVLNPKDHPDAKICDVVEIYHPEDEGTRLLLQITCFNEDIKGTRGIRDYFPIVKVQPRYFANM